jgi:AraC family transcriptional regulator, transcriptional activator of pobA
LLALPSHSCRRAAALARPKTEPRPAAPDPALPREDLGITFLEGQAAHPPVLYGQGKARQHQLLFVARGNGEGSASHDAWSFTAPALLLLPAGVTSQLIFSPEAAVFCISLSESLFTRLGRGHIAILDRPECITLTDEQAHEQELPETCLALVREFESQSATRLLALEAHLLRLLVGARRICELTGVVWRELESEDAALVRRFKDLVEARLRLGVPVRHYANILGVSERRLSLACRNELNRSPLEIIHDRVIVEAKHLLAQTTMSVNQIAATLGFNDPFYFSRFFRRETGATASCFRKAQMGWYSVSPLETA